VFWGARIAVETQTDLCGTTTCRCEWPPCLDLQLEDVTLSVKNGCVNSNVVGQGLLSSTVLSLRQGAERRSIGEKEGMCD
jgi:hypothetical protein